MCKLHHHDHIIGGRTIFKGGGGGKTDAIVPAVALAGRREVWSRALLLGALCFKFLCVGGLKGRLSNL